MQVVEPVVGGGGDRVGKRRTGVLAHHARESPSRVQPVAAVLERLEELGDARDGGERDLIVRRRPRRGQRAARWPMLRQRHVRAVLADHLGVGADAARPLEQLDLAARLAHLEAATDEAVGRRVPHAVHRHVALHIDDAVVQLVRLGHEVRQAGHMGALGGEELARCCVQLLVVLGVDLVAPRDCRGVCVVE